MLYAQTTEKSGDTTITYRDTAWKLIDKSKASYKTYRWLNSGMYMAKDYYYPSMVLHKEGGYLDSEDKRSHGEFTYYNNYGDVDYHAQFKNGNTMEHSNYFGVGNLRAVFKTDSTGVGSFELLDGKSNKLRGKGGVRANKMHGPATLYDKYGTVSMQAVMADGVLVSGECFDESGNLKNGKRNASCTL